MKVPSGKHIPGRATGSFILSPTMQANHWMDATNDDPSIIADARSGGSPNVYPEIAPKMMADIQTALSRLVAKAGQLIGNFTTNLAECWMHIRTKFDGGKVINRSQSGSFQHRCMGAGLCLNLGPTWGPTSWKSLTGSDPNETFIKTAKENEKFSKTGRENHQMKLKETEGKGNMPNQKMTQ